MAYPLSGSPFPFPPPGSPLPQMMGPSMPFVSYTPQPIILSPQPAPPPSYEVKKPAPPQEEKLDPCCSFPLSLVSCFCFVFIFFIIYLTVGIYLATGDNTNAAASTQFCNGYWRSNSTDKYMMQGYPVLGVWSVLNGSVLAALGLLIPIENLSAWCTAKAARDILRAVIALLVVFKLAWLFAGNIWTFDNDAGGRGVVPDACKKGMMGNRNLYFFCETVIIVEDIVLPLILLYVFGRTLFKQTFSG